jgi:hypothetical protein
MSRGSTRAEGPDLKAVAWKDNVVTLMAQTQTNAAINDLRKKIASNYGACRSAWPEMAAEIDNAERYARERIRGAKISSDDWDATEVADPVAER